MKPSPLLLTSLALTIIATTIPTTSSIAAGKRSDVSSSTAPVPEFTYIHVANELAGGKPLTVHCKTKKHDMGAHDVATKKEYVFKFKVSYTSSKTYECSLKNGKKEIVYKAYYEDAELLRRVNDDKSVWVAKDDGLYLRQDWKNTDTFWRPWV
ncbi:S-protein homolog 74 [Linum perenne]